LVSFAGFLAAHWDEKAEKPREIDKALAEGVKALRP